MTSQARTATPETASSTPATILSDMSSTSPVLLAFLFGFSAPQTEGDSACNRIREKERHAYCHCITAHGGKVEEHVSPGRYAFAREPGKQAGIMSCMERRGFGV